MSWFTINDPPDPVSASSQADFVAALRELRLWAGQPSLRRIRQLGGKTIDRSRGAVIDVLPESTTSYTLRGVRFPRAEFVRQFVAVCLRLRDRDHDEVASWVERWHDAWLGVVAPNRSAEAADRHPHDAVHVHESVVT